MSIHTALFLKYPQITHFFKTYVMTLKLAWQTNKKYFLFITLTGAFGGLLVYPELLITKHITDNIVYAITSGEVRAPLQAIILLTIVNIVLNRISHVLTDFSSVYSQTLSGLIKEKVSIDLSRKINSIPVPDAENPDIRNTFQKVMDTSGNAIWAITAPISTFPEIFFTLISTSILIFQFNGFILIPAIIFAIPKIKMGIKRTKEWRTIRNKYAPLWRIWAALEDFSTKGRYLYENKILNHVNLLLNRRLKLTVKYFKEFEGYRLKFAKLQRTYAIPHILFENGVRIYLFYLAIIQEMTLGTAQATNHSINRFVNNISHLVREINDLYQNYTFINDYESFMGMPDEVSTGILIDPQPKLGLTFENVWFKYQSSPDWILKDVSFTINNTDNVAIVGENGAGKTTLIKLICRFYQPNKGRITLNGVDIRDYNLDSYRSSLAALFQDFAQYPFSAQDNIHFGNIKKRIKSSDIKRVAQFTDIHHFINSLPKKYKNPLDKEFASGIEPSKGQWQRIALSRTLYRDAHLLILDEPTSNVDPESEEKIFDAVMKIDKDKMIFLVSHRFSTVRRADTILVLEQGQLIESGSHSELIKKKGRYAELFSIQAKSYH
jgi:ATP-binding cassette, subfamily B, bacterial